MYMDDRPGLTQVLRLPDSCDAKIAKSAISGHSGL